MVYDFSKKSNTYNAKSYKKADFTSTRCPKCHAVGQFNLHGSYYRYIVFFVMLDLVYKHIEIKRIRCLFCGATHAVMPGDLIPYKLLSLFAALYILSSYYLDRVPVLKIAAAWRFSFQFIYSSLTAFRLHSSRIYQYFWKASNGGIQAGLDDAGIMALIREPYMGFQSGYTESNRRPCFMCKFFNKANGPPSGVFIPFTAP
jgi:ribosomal protein S27E